MSATEERSTGSCYITLAISAFFVVGFFELVLPEVIPFKFFELWKLKGSLGEILRSSWPILVWGIAINAFLLVRSRNDPEVNRNSGWIMPIGLGLSLWAGIMEEISFRWLIFFEEIIIYKGANFLFFGFAGFGLFEWFFAHISGPIANFLTLGFMHPYLLGGLGWAVGSAMISSNGKFRDGHAYQGLLGWINSWFSGMFFFYLALKFGLPASILIHFLYDIFVFALQYIDASIERKLGWI